MSEEGKSSYQCAKDGGGLAHSKWLPFQGLGELVTLMSDNANVEAYLKEQWGTVSRVMCSLAQEIITWSELHMDTLTSRYILQKKSILADQQNHPDQVLPTEWSLFPWVFGALCKVCGCPYMDFATRASTKLLLYVATVPHPMAW